MRARICCDQIIHVRLIRNKTIIQLTGERISGSHDVIIEPQAELLRTRALHMREEDTVFLCLVLTADVG